MCGIVGFIGKPTDNQACFDLTTSLLVRTELRGDDASGYWATNDRNDKEGRVFFSKEPKKSSLFVKGEPWEAWENKDINLLISHCRRSSTKGSENKNRNNHPFVSKDSLSALVHNGNVPEFDVLRDKYDVMSDCDSEILLRIMERGYQYPTEFLKSQLGGLKSTSDKLIKDCKDEEIPEWSHKVLGLMDIFARINYGAMAVAIGERWADDTRALWLFRDRDRPLHVIDMRETLGQIYVVSDKRIFRDGVEAVTGLKRFVKANTPILEFPAMYIWLLMYKTNGEFAIRKFKVNRTRRHDTTSERERPALVENQDKPKAVRVITNLNYNNHEVDAGIPKDIDPAAIPKKPATKPATPTGIKTTNKTSTETVDESKKNSQSTQSVPGLYALTQVHDWPEDCYKYMRKYIMYSTCVLGCSKPCAPGSDSDLAVAAKEMKAPDPAETWVLKNQRVAAKITSKMDYIKWAQTLQTEFYWKPRYRNNLLINLTDILQQAHESWEAHIQTAQTNQDTAELTSIDHFPKDCYPFMHKFLVTASEPRGNWSDKGRVVCGPSQDIERSYLRAAIPDPTATNAILDDDDYDEWAKALQGHYGWCDRSIQGKAHSMSGLLKDARETWLCFIETTDTDHKVVPIQPPKENLNVPFEPNGEGSEPPDADNKAEYDLWCARSDKDAWDEDDYIDIRTSHMTVGNSDETLDTVDVELYHEALRELRQELADIETTVDELIREDSLGPNEFKDVVSSLRDIANSLRGENLVLDNARKAAI